MSKSNDFEKIWPPKERVFIIAEAGVNHNGDPSLACQLIDAAKQAGADAVKFQTWKPGEITGRFTAKADYMETTVSKDENRYELSCRLSLPFPVFSELKKYADDVGILFLSTPDGFESLDFLVNDLEMPIIKIGSSEVNHGAFLKAVAKCGKPVICSTGASTLGEVEKACSSLSEGGCHTPYLLHCTSNYPAAQEDINLRAIQTLKNAFNLPVGLSDHSTGIEAAMGAVALGACIIEKHFTLEKELEGPDHKASLKPDELASLVSSVRILEEMMGNGLKKPRQSELENLPHIRRSVVAAKDLKEGVIITDDLLICKRPGTGIDPNDLQKLIGRKLLTNKEGDEPISWRDVV